MNDVKKYLVIFILAAVVVSCSPVQHSFSAKGGLPASMYSEALNEVSQRAGGGNGKTSVYRVVFREKAIESDNLIEHTNRSETSTAESVDYINYALYWYEIYLVAQENISSKSFVYVPVRYKMNLNEETRQFDTVCIGFGPSYAGTGNFVNDNYVIRFTQALKPVKRDGSFVLKKQGKRNNRNLLFVADSVQVTPQRICISRIVNTANNKTGGSKDEVFVVDSVFNNPRALQFTLQQQ
jgi:hypothetical protein